MTVQKLIGESPTYIIAEIGINHNGDMNNVFNPIDIASEAGCNAVKVSEKDTRTCVPESEWEVRRETPWGEMSYIDYKKKIELSINQYKEIDNYCKQNKLHGLIMLG